MEPALEEYPDNFSAKPLKPYSAIYSGRCSGPVLKANRQIEIDSKGQKCQTFLGERSAIVLIHIKIRLHLDPVGDIPSQR